MLNLLLNFIKNFSYENYYLYLMAIFFIYFLIKKQYQSICYIIGQGQLSREIEKFRTVFLFIVRDLQKIRKSAEQDREGFCLCVIVILPGRAHGVVKRGRIR